MLVEAPAVGDEEQRSTKPLSETAFRQAERQYRLYEPDRRQVRKGRVPPPQPTDLSAVVDMRHPERNSEANRAMMSTVPVDWNAVAGPSPAEVVLPQARRQAVRFSGVPGLMLFPSALSEAEQQFWCREALTSFARPPHPNNVSTLQPGFVSEDGYGAGMRWSTLGYSYDWTNRTYARERHSPFPSRLQQLVRQIVATLPLVDPTLGPGCTSGYDAQTAICNYYPVGSSMCAHQDLSETCLGRPLVSISLGCSCVFLMGTTSRDDAPHAFLLRSGDVAVFTGPSRLAFHGVPRILDDTPACLMPSDPSDALKKMLGLRINLNVRQVYEVEGSPDDDGIADDDTQPKKKESVP